MWYTEALKQDLMNGMGYRAINEFARKMYAEIYRKAEGSEDDEIHVWFNPSEGKWLVSMGDWADTPKAVVEKAINNIAKDLHSCLVTFTDTRWEYKKPEIEFDRETSGYGHGEDGWFLIAHDFRVI